MQTGQTHESDSSVMPSCLDTWQATAGFPTGSIAVATETVMPLLNSCSSYHAIN
jgi:hypothetical protein